MSLQAPPDLPPPASLKLPSHPHPIFFSVPTAQPVQFPQGYVCWARGKAGLILVDRQCVSRRLAGISGWNPRATPTPWGFQCVQPAHLVIPWDSSTKPRTHFQAVIKNDKLKSLQDIEGGKKRGKRWVLKIGKNIRQCWANMERCVPKMSRLKLAA